MTNWKCTCDIFSFCNGVPDWEKEPFQQDMRDGQGVITKGPFIAGKCKLDKETCGRLIKFSDVVKFEERLSKSTLKETVIPIGNMKAKVEEIANKKKTAKAKKFEQELNQGSFL